MKNMIHRKNTFFLGIFIFLIPFLGVPSYWRLMLVTLSGLGLILLSIKINVSRKNTKGRTRRERSTPVFVESSPVYPKDNTIEMADTNTGIVSEPDIK